MMTSSMPKTPKVAIITRTRNRPVFLNRAMQSVLNQTLDDWLHVIVNDGGDQTELENAVAPFKEKYQERLLILHQEHEGMQRAANNGIQASQSTYIVIHDDDDSWDPDFLSQTWAFLEEKGPRSRYQGVISQSLKVLETYSNDEHFLEIERTPYVPLQEINLFRVGYENPFPPIAFLYRRSVHKSIGMFDEEWDMVADLDFNYRFLKKYEIGVIPKPLALYHWRTTSPNDPNATNTVTARAHEHGNKLNELKNHYLRQASSAQDAALALGFQLSAFSVQNQWMTAEIRESTIEGVHHVRGMSKQLISALEQFGFLSKFIQNALWDKISTDIPTKLTQQDSRLALLQEYAQALSEAISKLSAVIDEAQKHQASTLAHGTAHIHESIAQAQQAIAELSTGFNNLDRLAASIDQEIWPKVSTAIPSQIEATKAEITAGIEALKENASSSGSVLAHLSESLAKTFPVLESVTKTNKWLTEMAQTHYQSTLALASSLEDTNSGQAELKKTISQISKQLQTISNERVYLKIGPFKLTRSRSKPTSDA